MLVLVAGACGEADDGEVAAGDASTTTVVSEPSPGAQDGEWRQIADPPASVAPGAPAVWTGSDVVVWGGGFGPDGTHEVGGATYDPAADEWSELPEAPIDVAAGATAVWTGKEAIFWGGAEITSRQADASHSAVASGAAYDPVKKSWRRVAESPLTARAFHDAVWTGKEMFIWGGMPGVPVHGAIHDPTAAAYDPRSDTWRTLAEVPRPWSGDGGSTVTRAFAGDMFVWRDDELAQYSVEEDSWQSLGGGPRDPDAPFDMSSVGPTSVGAVVGDTFYVWTGGTRPVEGLALRLPSGGAKAVADSPHFTGFLPRLTAAGDAIFAINYDHQDSAEPGEGSSAWRYDLSEDSWERLPNPPAEVGAGATPIWTGNELVVLPTTFGDDQQRGTGAVFAKR